MSTAPVQIYAELLTNIRHVSISVTLPTPADATTVVELLPPSQQQQQQQQQQDAAVQGLARLRVRHQGACQAEMTLPGRVAMAAERPVRLPLPQGKGGAAAAGSGGGGVLPSYLTWRLPIKTKGALSSARSGDDELAPWSAPDLQPCSAVTCRACGAVIVPADRIATWKDLPSDNWAEMMEFWHCHKPEHKHQLGHGAAAPAAATTEDALAGRGYGANSVIAAQAGVGFVDLITLLFTEGDCQGLLYSASTVDKATADRAAVLAAAVEPKTATAAAAPRGLDVFCASCHAQLGYFNNLRMQSVNLFKWQVGCASSSSVSGRGGASSPPPSVADCVAATLVATIARTGSSKSVILPIYEASVGDKRDAKALQVWVLNSNICFASTTALASSAGPVATTPPRRAIKLLYKHIDRAEADRLTETLSSDVQEINLPGETITAVTEQLEASNALLPGNERTFKDWKIGLIVRWARASSKTEG